MPLYEEKFISPCCIRFSQARIRPTFQDGRLVERSCSQIEVVPWDKERFGNSDYDVLLRCPFPPIEIIRWKPKVRDQDGCTLVDEDGKLVMGEPCWFTFDNRRLYCLQAAVAQQWPKRCCAIVYIMHDLPISKCAPRKFRTTDLGSSVRIARRNDPVPRAIWCWSEATAHHEETHPEAHQIAMAHIAKDAAKESYDQLVDVPYEFDRYAEKGSDNPVIGMGAGCGSCMEVPDYPEQEVSPKSRAVANSLAYDQEEEESRTQRVSLWDSIPAAKPPAPRQPASRPPGNHAGITVAELAAAANAVAQASQALQVAAARSSATRSAPGEEQTL